MNATAPCAKLKMPDGLVGEHQPGGHHRVDRTRHRARDDDVDQLVHASPRAMAWPPRIRRASRSMTCQQQMPKCTAAERRPTQRWAEPVRGDVSMVARGPEQRDEHRGPAQVHVGHVLPRVPDPAEHLDRALGHGAERIAGPERGERRRARRGRARRTRRPWRRARRAPGSPRSAARWSTRRCLIGLEGADRPTERDPFARVVDRGRVGGGRDAGELGGPARA